MWKKGPGPNTARYEGDYLDDKKNGKGLFIWASGNIYKGEYKDDERHGKGEMKWTDGSRYIVLFYSLTAVSKKENLKTMSIKDPDKDHLKDLTTPTLQVI
jgi:hypothetical protein